MIRPWSIPLRVIFCFSVQASFAQAPADLLVYNAKVYTMNAAWDTAEAFAVRNGKILELGKTAGIRKKYKAAQTLDAKGKAIYPGFIDAHAHFLAYAQELTQVNLTGTQSWEECLDRI